MRKNKLIITLCKNCKGKIRHNLIGIGKTFCSETCRKLYQGRAYRVAIPKESVAQLKYLTMVTGMSRMDLIQRSITYYVQYYEESHKGE